MIPLNRNVDVKRDEELLLSMMSQTAKGLLFVLVGPGGTGKNTLMNIVKNRHSEIAQLATATTRAMRASEQQGREHHFVSVERFKEMIANDELLEHQEVTTGKFYGIIRATVEESINKGQHLMADIEVLGAKVLQEKFPDDSVFIFITVPGETIAEKRRVLRERMMARLNGEATDADLARIQERLNRAVELEFPFEEECDFVVVNDDKDEAANELEAIILRKIAERQPSKEEA